LNSRERRTSAQSASFWISQISEELAGLHLLIRDLKAARAKDGTLSVADETKLSDLENEYQMKMRHRDSALELHQHLKSHEPN
jgi:hypothetical protein